MFLKLMNGKFQKKEIINILQKFKKNCYKIRLMNSEIDLKQESIYQF